MIDSSLTVYNHRLRVVNHGIREENILSMLLPIGVNPADIEDDWLDDINSFAKKRGLMAHTSQYSRIFTVQVNPKDEWEMIKRLWAGIMKIDDKILQLHSQL